MSTNYADSIAQAQRNAAGKQGEKKKRDAGLSADIAAELKGALDDVEAPMASEAQLAEVSTVPAPSKPPEAENAAAAAPVPVPVPPARARRVAAEPRQAAVAPAADVRAVASRSPMVRQGIEFRREDLDLITEMLYRCHRQKINLQGKKGPSIIVRVALDELTAIYTTEPERFDAIMSRYAEKKKTA